MHRFVTLLVLAVLVGGAASQTSAAKLSPADPKYRFAHKPIVEFEGRITDGRTGEGLPDVFVIVNMRTFRSVPFGHGVSGCNISSQIVKTDDSGIYRVHWSWAEHGEEPPDDLSVNVKAYKQGWAHYPRAQKTGSSFLVSMQRDFQMVPQEQPFSERMDTLVRFQGDNCIQIWGSDLAPAMSKALHDEAWELACESVPAEGIVYDDSWRVNKLLQGYIGRTWIMNRPSATDVDLDRWWQQRRSRLKAAMSAYPWKDLRSRGDPNAPPFSAADLTAYCATYAQSLRLAEGADR